VSRKRSLEIRMDICEIDWSGARGWHSSYRNKTFIYGPYFSVSRIAQDFRILKNWIATPGRRRCKPDTLRAKG